ncbi:hypothetical protein D3C78_1734630 [compost metagenome]
MQAVGQAFFFGQLLHPLGTDHRQLTLEFGDPGFQHAVGVGELARHLIEQRERLLKTKPACLLYAGRVGDWRHLGGVGHRALSLG